MFTRASLHSPVLIHMNPMHTLKTLFLKSTFILSSHLRLGLSNGFFPSSFWTKVLYKFFISPLHGSCHVYVIPLEMTLIMLVKSIDYEALHYEILSSLLLFHPCKVQIFSQVLCSGQPWTSVIFLTSGIVFRTHTKQQVKEFSVF